ncbi:hypothetical protein KIN20_017549 [Parelaphostrongylus tenuis]|uniref:Protein-cysteine N-palmitoyltransferase Rasp n=1 Tax=Parelaphostrongylus tenuis TaxID=148309 RepID=A0AAD5QNQ3_PARTN|nr:hypothetical protein KIN20_017549 [Parelaphostrongylus tenuis]
MSYGRYSPVPLNRWEKSLCWFIWIAHSAAAFVATIMVSRTKLKHNQFWFSESSYIADAKMDLTDLEWLHFRNTILQEVLHHCLHSVIFFLVIRFVTTKWVKLALSLVGLLIHVHMTSPQCVLILTTVSIVVTSLSIYTRHIAVPWVLCLAVVMRGTRVFPFSKRGFDYYLEFNAYMYGAIKILNFSLHMCKNKELKYADVWKDHLAYMGYLPYSSTLIVLFDDFSRQLERRLNNFAVAIDGTHLRFTGWFAIRILFWYFVYEFILHIIYAPSVFHSPFSDISGLNNYEVAAVAYVAGTLFYMKYVVIFGVPAAFAYLDGMRPPPPPICNSRVSRYSLMWRHFDVGLYQFLKNQVYIPLLKIPLSPFLSVVRIFCTLVAVFGVVLSWHGFKTNYICWVSLSALELIIERLGRVIWNTVHFQLLRQRIGEINTRRVVAAGMLATVIPGIFGVFFFLGEQGIGAVVFQRVLIDGGIDFIKGNIFLSSDSDALVFIHLIILGYFFNHVCLDFEAKYEPKKAAEE